MKTYQILYIYISIRSRGNCQYKISLVPRGFNWSPIVTSSLTVKTYQREAMFLQEITNRTEFRLLNLMKIRKKSRSL